MEKPITESPAEADDIVSAAEKKGIKIVNVGIGPGWELPTEYKNRVKEYMGVLGNNVDIWEIGNEINGEWLGSKQSVINKIS